MPVPVVAIAGTVLAAVGPWIMRFFAAKAVIMVAKFLANMGIVLATNEYLMQPLIDHVMNAWNAIPAQFQCWFALFGVTKAAGIYVSAMTLVMAKQIFLQKSS